MASRLLASAPGQSLASRQAFAAFAALRVGLDMAEDRTGDGVLVAGLVSAAATDGGVWVTPPLRSDSRYTGPTWASDAVMTRRGELQEAGSSSRPARELPRLPLALFRPGSLMVLPSPPLHLCLISCLPLAPAHPLLAPPAFSS